MGLYHDADAPKWWQGSTDDILARIEDVRMQMEQAKRQSDERIAEAFRFAGIQLIPSDHLKDNQYIVPRSVYDAAMRLAEKGSSDDR